MIAVDGMLASDMSGRLIPGGKQMRGPRFSSGCFGCVGLTRRGRNLVIRASADRSVRIELVKAGWFVGASGGNGTLAFGGRTYPLVISGLSAGLTFGVSGTTLTGSATNLRTASDIAGTYSAVGSAIAVAGGGRAIAMRNGRGVVLNLSGATVGFAFDFMSLSGMTIRLR